MTCLVARSVSITNVAHQLGYFETIASVEDYRRLPSRIAATTVDEVNAAAATLFRPANRTIGWFNPSDAEPGAGGATREDAR